jgi:propanol-preferring alcohol dehydrogenase
MQPPSQMRAMVMHRAGQPLTPERLPVPTPGPGQLLLRVRACGVCRTDLHVLDGELPDPKLPLVPGHEIVGEVVQLGAGVNRFHPGARVGVPWLGRTDGACPYCRAGRENLCENPGFTGYTLDGGYAEYVSADAAFCFPLPESFDDIQAAPLLCAGLIGYRTLRLCGDDARRLGIYGFGAAAHIVAQLARFQDREVYAFTRPGDHQAQEFARRLGATWAGDSGQPPPRALDAAMIFAPVGELVVAGLKAIRRGGVVVSGGIHMSDIPAFPYRLLWHERVIRSVANLTRQDGEEFLALAPRVPIRTSVEPFALEQANEALGRLRSGQLEGAAVLTMDSAEPAEAPTSPSTHG